MLVQETCRLFSVQGGVERVALSQLELLVQLLDFDYRLYHRDLSLVVRARMVRVEAVLQ